MLLPLCTQKGPDGFQDHGTRGAAPALADGAVRLGDGDQGRRLGTRDAGLEPRPVRLAFDHEIVGVVGEAVSQMRTTYRRSRRNVAQSSRSTRACGNTAATTPRACSGTPNVSLNSVSCGSLSPGGFARVTRPYRTPARPAARFGAQPSPRTPRPRCWPSAPARPTGPDPGRRPRRGAPAFARKAGRSVARAACEAPSLGPAE
jgi:hypothetical protein